MGSLSLGGLGPIGSSLGGRGLTGSISLGGLGRGLPGPN